MAKSSEDRPRVGLHNLRDKVAKYDKAKGDYPGEKYLLDMVPGVGQVTSALDTVSALDKGNYGDAALNAIGVIPGVKYIPARGLVKSAKKYAGKGFAAARNFDRGMDTAEYIGSEREKAKKPVVKKAKGGSVGSASKRADGCATKGKTKGRMV
jgi:hypothetical protein